MSVKLHTPAQKSATNFSLSFRKLPIPGSIALAVADFLPGLLIALIS
jgi:hypothetical protein